MKHVQHKGFSAIEALVIVVVLALVGAVGVVMYNRHENRTVSQVSPAQMISNLQKSIPAKYSYATVDTTKKIPLWELAYAVDGSKYKVASDLTEHMDFAIKSTTVAQSQTVLTAVADQLQADGFSYVSDPPIIIKETANNAPYNADHAGYYKRSDRICLLGFNYYNSVPDVLLGCTSPTALSAVAKAAEPFAAVYMKYEAANYLLPQGPDTGRYNSFNAYNGLYAKPYFGTLTVKDSKNAGYKYARLRVGDAAAFPSIGATALFYTDSSGANWQYLTASEGGFLECSTIKPVDAQKALADVCSPTGP